ncbi:MAG TPA: hypothetical protein VFP98_06520, partial [Candidatus Polarisedimenticolia bacterium]|nr:hypothetical protein [Candidatus Polarisedimenticolia bacterium]
MMDATRTSTLANDWLKDFCLALKNVSLYSADHPRGKEYLERAYESLRAAMGQKREAALTRAESRLHFDQILLDRDITLAAQLAEDLDARRVDSLVFHSTLTPEEHLGFIRALLTKVDRVAEKGGFGQVLIDEGVSSIKVNVERPAPAWGMLESTPAGQATLVDFVLQLSSRQAPKEQAANGNGEPLASQVLAGDAGALMRAILEAAKNREAGPPSGPEAMAEVMADTLERLAERALEEHRRDRHEILLDVGRAVVAADPDTHPTLLLEKAGPRSIRKLLVSAVEGLPPRLIAELVGHHYERAAGDYRKLTEMVNRAHAWRDDREAVSAEVEKRLAASGLSAQRAHECIDHLVWSELSLARRLELLQQADLLWRVDFSRLKEVLLKLLATDQIRESTGLIQKYLDALSSDDLEIRRLTADNARHLLQLIDKTGKGLEMLPRMAELFLARLQEEQDPDVVARLAGGLAFLVDLRLRSGNLGEALALMRKVDLLASSGSPTLKERGLKLAEALGRAGSDKMFGKLAEMLLEGNDQSSREAAEILKRGGSRSANYLIERLAEEENRSHRARLVMLLKEMGKGTSAPFVSRLDDPRWFLVRNVVGILG